MAVDMREVLALPMVVEPNEERSSLMIEERKLKVQLTGCRRLRRPHSSQYLAHPHHLVVFARAASLPSPLPFPRDVSDSLTSYS